MSALLTTAEIEALRAGGSRASKTADSVVRYNFRRPDRISKEQLHALQFLHDRCARNMSTSFSAYLRTTISLAVSSVEQWSYEEFLGIGRRPDGVLRARHRALSMSWVHSRSIPAWRSR
jgi:flagellar motor switch protein FliM